MAFKGLVRRSVHSSNVCDDFVDPLILTVGKVNTLKSIPYKGTRAGGAPDERRSNVFRT